MKFTRAYNSSSVCTPSRYTCLTGQFASRCTTHRFLKSNPPGWQSNVGFNVQVEPGSWNVARVLRENGYRTGFVGKWHTGTPPLLTIPSDAKLRDPPEIQQKIDNKTLGRPAYHMDAPLNLQELAFKQHPGYWDMDQLYDLEADPGERVNLANDTQHAATVAALKRQLRKWLVGFNRPFGEP